jgi:uncharacterized RDD family membrane protein YckC
LIVFAVLNAVLAIVLLVPLLVLNLDAYGGFFSGFSAIFGLFIVWGYYVALEGSAGATIGKRFMDLKVKSLSGDMSYTKAFVRSFTKAWLPVFTALFALDLIVGFLTQGDPKQRFSDMVADTVIAMSKVVLSFSGGLDTSVCVPLLRERYQYEKVITVTVDVGQPRSDLKKAEARAATLSDKHYTVDAKEEFVEQYLFPLIKANGSYEGYTLGQAIARPLIAKKVLELADREHVSAVAHGCTGKGNDQLRFEAVFRASKYKIHAPMR